MRAEVNGDNFTTARRRRSKQERREIVEESLQPGASVAVVARAHGVKANQVFHWRKLYREGWFDVEPATAELVPVQLTETSNHKPVVTRPCSGVIRLELGRVRVHLEGPVDPESLRVILEHFGR
jgi:transposase